MPLVRSAPVVRSARAARADVASRASGEQVVQDHRAGDRHVQARRVVGERAREVAHRDAHHRVGEVEDRARHAVLLGAEDHDRLRGRPEAGEIHGRGRVLAGDDRVAMLAPLHLSGRLGTVDEIAMAALYLASDASSFMTGADMLVDGGYTAH